MESPTFGSVFTAQKEKKINLPKLQVDIFYDDFDSQHRQFVEQLPLTHGNYPKQFAICYDLQSMQIYHNYFDYKSQPTHGSLSKQL